MAASMHSGVTCASIVASSRLSVIVDLSNSVLSAAILRLAFPVVALAPLRDVQADRRHAIVAKSTRSGPRRLFVDGVDRLLKRRWGSSEQARVGLTEFKDQEYRASHSKCAERERGQSCGVDAGKQAEAAEQEE